MSAQPQPDPHRGNIPLDEAIRWHSLPRLNGSEPDDEDDDLVPLGIDVTALAPADLGGQGISLRPHARVADIRGTMRPWLTHSEFSVRYPSEDKVARSLAREAASFWWKRKRTLKGLVIHRSFPCLGAFRVVNDGAETGPLIVVCDRCGDCVGVRRDEFDKALSDSLK